MRDWPANRAYVARRTAQGKRPQEIRRCLKRYIARQLYRTLTDTMATAPDTSVGWKESPRLDSTSQRHAVAPSTCSGTPNRPRTYTTSGDRDVTRRLAFRSAGTSPVNQLVRSLD
jgi:hypothetical protein